MNEPIRTREKVLQVRREMRIMSAEAERRGCGLSVGSMARIPTQQYQLNVPAIKFTMREPRARHLM